jgi:hypothetical protein
VTFISVSEVLAALGLILPGAVLEVLAVAGILPAVVGIAAVLVPLAAVGLVLLMIGATITHAIRREWTMIRIVPSVATTLPSPGSFSPPVKTNTPASSGRPSTPATNASLRIRQAPGRNPVPYHAFLSPPPGDQRSRAPTGPLVGRATQEE